MKESGNEVHRPWSHARRAAGCALLALLALLASSAGCAHAPARRAASNLAGREFLLQSAEGTTALSGAVVHLHFAATELSAAASCNHLFGGYELRGTRLSVAPMGRTEMGCERTEQQRDDWLAAFLASSPTVALSGATLTLASKDAQLVFIDRKVADPDRPLRRTSWEVGTYSDGESAIGLLGIAAPRLVFADDGTWTLHATCFDGRGAFVFERGALTLVRSAFTEVAQPCGADNDRSADELVRDVLRDGELSYRIQGSTLTLERGARGLTLSAAK